MLRVVQQSSPDAAKSYYSRSDYLSEGQELVGHWGGRGAERLRLQGVIQKKDFDLLCDNLDPRTGDRLTARKNHERTCGYDFNFSVPKSVSLIYAVTEDKGLLDAFRDSVEETMRDVEAEMKTRVRKGGQESNRLTGNAVWATFYHFTSRPVDNIPDPQMHAHAFVFNSTFDSIEQRWKAGQFRDLKRDAPYFQAMFRSRLANRLQALGYSIERRKDDFEIVGIERNTLSRFSRRSTKIEEIAQELGITDPKAKDGLGRATREHKNKTLSWDQLRDEWRARLSEGERNGLLDCKSPQPVARELGEREAVDHAILHAFERESVVRERDLKTEALRFGVGRVTFKGLEKEWAKRHLIVRTVDGERLVTTPGVIAEERRIIDFARNGRGTCPSLGGFDRTITRRHLNSQQQRAVRHLWESPNRVMLIRGAAGSGKSTLLKEAVEGIEANGHHVVALAPSSEASRGVLRSEGFKEADTVARFFQDRAFQESARDGVILIDEASLLGTKALAKVVSIAEERNARLILVGDPNQNTSVERGGATFRLLREEAALPVHEVTEIIRQERAEYKQAVEALSAGRTTEGLDALDKLGWVHEAPDGEREEQIAKAYLAAIAEQKADGKLKRAIVVTPTNSEAASITSAIRSALKQKGLLGEERVFAVWTPSNLTEAERLDSANYLPGEMLQFHKAAPGHRAGDRVIVEPDHEIPTSHAERFQVYHPSAIPVAVGDKLRVTANGRDLNGHRLENGSTFHVAGFTPTGDIVDDRAWVISKDFGHLASGHVLTSWKSQGRTVEKAFVSQTSASGRAASAAQFYVSASRARESVHIFCDDKQELRQAILGDRVRVTATELARHPGERLRRLRRHLSFLKRLNVFEQTHNRNRPIERTQAKELEHER